MDTKAYDDQTVDSWINNIFNAIPTYILTQLPSNEKTQKKITVNTRAVTSSLLRKILANGDSPYHHKELNYDTILLLQLELLKQLLSCEKQIQYYRKTFRNSSLIEPLRERRRILKFLGSSLAWIVLEGDRGYIRNLARNKDPGFIVGKTGTLAELNYLFKEHKPNNEYTVLLHDITQCLRIADVSIVWGSAHAPLEIKLISKHYKPNKRGRRQNRDLKNLKEYFTKGFTTKFIPGWTTVRSKARKRDIHHWDALAKVSQSAIDTGTGIEFPEPAIAYYAYNDLSQLERLGLAIKNRWENPIIIFGDFRKQIDGILEDGLLEMMPFLLYEIPLEIKEHILFGDLQIMTVIDLNSLTSTFKELGIDASIQEDKITIKQSGFPDAIIGPGLINRLLYECLSTETLRDYLLSSSWKEALKKVSKK